MVQGTTTSFHGIFQSHRVTVTVSQSPLQRCRDTAVAVTGLPLPHHQPLHPLHRLWHPPGCFAERLLCMSLLENQWSQRKWHEDMTRAGQGCGVWQEKHFVLQQQVVGAAVLLPYSCSNHEIGSAAAPGTLNSVSAALWFTRGGGGTAVQLLGAKFVRSHKEMCWKTHQSTLRPSFHLCNTKYASLAQKNTQGQQLGFHF